MADDNSRRSFLGVLAATAGAASLPRKAAASLAAPTPTAAGEPPTVAAVIETIVSAIPGAPRQDTVDVVKAGDASQTCTGVVTTFLGTLEVLRRAKALGANLVISHEPVFYSHQDRTDWLAGDRVYEAKRRFIEERRLVIWRAHDTWHTLKPDPVTVGTLALLHWERYATAGAEHLCELPPTSVGALASELKRTLGSHGVRYVGDPAQSVRRVALNVGAAGGQTHLRTLRQTDADALLVGELQEWETSEYVRDSNAAGWPKAVIVVGHEASEEAGMRALADWLRPRVPGLAVTHVPAGDAFTYV
jgi:putative NIF3 family GTP cyclohydrolase 1 type 2